MLARVLLVDDHHVMRQALRTLLEQKTDLRIVDEASSGREAVKMAVKHEPDLVLMDVTMPDLNGVEATRRIKKDCPNTKVIALSMHTDQQYVIKMLKAGASGYLLKNCSFDELQGAITRVLEGGSYISPQAADVLVNQLHTGPVKEGDSEVQTLTSREREILQMIAEAKKSKEIAEKLCISSKTVYTHRRNIMEKLHAKNAADLTRIAIKNGLTSLEQ
jgi:DNA-binding NarL/FixJ family response regulator